MLGTAELQDALSNWRSDPERLLTALGFDPLRLPVARPGLADFGLDPDDPVALEVLAFDAPDDRRLVLASLLSAYRGPLALVAVLTSLTRPAR